ncbi:glycine cleavage system protein T [Candidatus Methylomirabilis lanthanidiphila]|uniref:Aminomethyltransferase n=1 Tax=Candidatus Methylomirabilis lanthanidiphila TaxID=2211376 RepID=A0A564ZL41_9BACT|nr:glycine cleavage system aminomethyltransferase GcvT [Candidatus Methylomirabilis lanthanidiphila]VUZ86050.1 glycine cleavage system protein T [Candidatus Methylomirabilis lanthanidiphila]
MSAVTGPVKRTPLFETHRQLGARMIPFGGWEMPVQYAGILEEHRAVRERAGLFDISHMGEIEISGHGALDAVQYLTSNDASRLSVGEVQYSVLTTPEGTFVDDITVYKWADDRYWLTVNAANTEKDVAWIRDHVAHVAEIRNISADIALLAIQGPRAQEILERLASVELSRLKYYFFVEGRVAGIGCCISRTGYTGEDGFELYIPPQHAVTLWNTLLEAGAPAGLQPCGLGARDTLRLEAKMALYGQDIDDRHTVLEADLGWIVKLEKGEFIGREALARQKAEGVSRKLVGFEMVGRGIARPHYTIVRDRVPIGEVTSGGPAPSLEKNIGLGYVPAQYAAIGTEFDVVVRGQPVTARVIRTPFYKRQRCS